MRKEEKTERENIIKTSSIIINDVLYEQVYNEKNQKSYFIKEGETEKVSTKGTWKPILYECIENNGIKYYPINDEEVTKKVILLPENAHPYVDVEELIIKIKNHVHKYCDVTPDFEEIAAYYVLLTYVYDQFTEIPYLSLMGDSGTGKTRVRDVIGMICYKPILCNGGTSAAALYRITEKWGGTILMDEADIKDSDEGNDVIKYFNCGYQKNTPIMKCDKNDPNKLDFFNPYCPKIITRRQPFEDKATESRCINEVMFTTNRKNIPFNLPNVFFSECSFLRNKLLSFRLCNWKRYKNLTIDEVNKEYDCLDIEPRLKQVSSSILALLLPFPNDLARFKNFLVRKQLDLVQERADSYDGRIINAIYELLEVQKKEVLTCKDICDFLNVDVVNLKYSSNPKSVGKRLKSLGISNGKLERQGEVVKRILKFDSGKMAELYKKYVEFLNKNVTSVTYVTSLLNTADNNNNMNFKDFVTSEGVSLSNVTNVTNVTKTKKHNDYAVMTEFLKNNDFEGNDIQLFELFDEKLIHSAQNCGLVFCPKPNWYKLV